MIAFLNANFLPEAEATVSLNDRGFLLGDGLFETVRVANGKPFRLPSHLARLESGADFLRIKLPFSPAEIQAFIAQLIGKNNLPEAVLRLTLTRGPAERGYSFKNSGPPTLAMTLHPLPESPAGYKMLTSLFRIPAGDPLASFKTTNKLLNVLARAEAKERGADEALLLNTNGEATEAAGGNLFWISHGKVCTVPTDCGVLPGITRALVLELCGKLGIKAAQSVVKPEHLREVEGIFVTQSVLGIVPVTFLDGFPVTPSPLVDRLVFAYQADLQHESI